MRYPFILLSALCFFSQSAQAQFAPGQIYLQDHSVKIYAGAKEKSMAWCGGTNNPQVSMADLNKDGIKDLIIYDKDQMGNSPKTFINESAVPGSPKYVYRPEYEANFPPVNDYLKMVDYNRDGVPDMVHRGGYGITPYKGVYNDNNQLTFERIKFRRDPVNGDMEGLWYFLKNSGMINAYVSPGDIPTMGDLDGDQDLDFLSYDINGVFIAFYRGCQVEESKITDSIPICVKDNCWGKTAQGYERALRLAWNCSSSTFGTTCKGCDAPDEGSGNKTTHSGNTLCMIDYDGDGDMDILNGNVSFSELQLTINGKKDLNYPIDTIIYQDTVWNSHDGHELHMTTFPMAFWEDIDNDGDRDILVAPFAEGSENYRCLAYFKNVGNDASPNFRYQMDSLFIEDMIDIGTGSSPYFYDYNKDGKPDLLIGSDGYYQADGSLRTRVTYYENTSTTNNPRFDLRTTDFLNMDTLNIRGAAMAIGDLDGDGKDDLVIGKNDGTLMIYKNSATTGTTTPEWYQPVIMRDAGSAIIDVGDYAAPVIYDINNDGKKDLIIGSQIGKLWYYKNIGTLLGVANLQKITDTLGGVMIKEQNQLYTYVMPYIGKIDDSGKDYLLIGSRNGILYKYDGLAGGKTTGYKRVDSFYSNIKVRERAAPAVADIDGNGMYDMVIGNTLGGVNLYRQFFNVGVDDRSFTNGDVKVYPNPASDMINVSWTSNIASSDVEVSIVSITGQKIWAATAKQGTSSVQINTTGISSGVYYCIVRSAGSQSVTPVSIVK